MKIEAKLFDKKNRFLLEAEEPFLVHEFISQVKSALPDSPLYLCYSSEDYLEKYHQGDMFSSNKKILVLWDFVADDVECIDSLLESPTEDVQILIKRTTISKNKAFTRIYADYTVVKLDKVTKHGCATWIRDYFRAHSMEYDTSVPEIIVERVGPDLYLLQGTMRKLQALATKVTPETCNRVLTYIPETKFFDFFDALVRRRVENLLTEFQKIDEGSYNQLLHFLMSQIEKLYQVASLRQQKHNEEEITEIVGVPKFILRTKMLPAISSFNRVKLVLLLEHINNLEKMLRSTKYPKHTVFESYLLKAVKI